MRGRNLIILATGIVVVIAAVVLTINLTGRSGANGQRTASSKPGAAHAGGTHPNPQPLPPGAVSPTIGLRPGATSPSASGLRTAETLLPKLTNKQLAGQRVIYSYTGLTPPAQLITLIKQGDVAGVIFFSNNISSLSQITAVAKQLQQAAMAPSDPVHLPLLLMTDQEGGQVRRLPGPPYLSEKQIGQSAHPWATATAEGKAAGQLLHSVGLNVNLSPVLDVYRQAGNFIDEFGRSFSNNAAKVAKLGTLFATAEQGQGIAATAKHFPGLGAAATNQDTDMRPVTLNIPLSAIRSIDEKPYKSVIPAGVKLVMVSWAIYPALDAKYPAGLSSVIVQGELRQRLGFGGVTITDALEAGALNPFGSIAHRSTLAARAGMDLLLCAEGQPSEGVSAMNSLSYDYGHKSLNQSAFKAAVERILALRASLAKG
ncbi:MAG TPA: glycoside hydrolase family 3 N-terminal domain-containing protein [Streptosporangiaceae bacterium]|nr:glycoside hydrolase family 3 N-terminal domain-containing protein [Streptosporangiaceae bacterium]